MRTMILGILLGAGAVMATENWNGFLDTANINTFKKDSLKYSKAFELSRYEDLAVQVKANDTNSAGFASDSIALKYGYQLGYPCLTSTGTWDTGWTPIVYVDSMPLANIGSYPTTSYADSALYTHKAGAWIDTTTVTGWAWQATAIVPECAPLIRFAVKGLTGNRLGGWIRLQLQVHRRLHVKTGD